ncbi:MAG: hypothetical protein K8E24_007765 [Methanobacterium paludis]|nr:hypothetical protein [Methanobacterium paludis]
MIIDNNLQFDDNMDIRRNNWRRILGTIGKIKEIMMNKALDLEISKIKSFRNNYVTALNLEVRGDKKI